MLPGFLLALREGLEIALILGIVLGALKKTERSELGPMVWGGAITAALLSVLVAIILRSIGAALEGRAEEIFEGMMMLAAAGVLTWMIFWMQRQARYLKSELEAGVRQATGQAGRWALFSLAFIAVIREGIELALFLTAAALTSSGWATYLGAALGLLAAAGLGWALFSATLRLNLQVFFQVTSILLLLFAAGLVAHGIHELNEASVIPGVIEHVWDTNPYLDEASFSGSLLGTVFGYNGNPSLTEVLAYFGYLAVVLFALWRSGQPRPAPQPA